MSSREATPGGTHGRREYRFADFTLDLDSGFLRRGADEIPLRPKTFEVLNYLVERHGRLVTKAELMDAVWPDAEVTENSVAQCLLEVRRALGDESQQLIRTVARRGYIFTARPTLPNQWSTGRVSGRDWAFPLVLVLGVAGVISLWLMRPSEGVTYTQLTHFTDSATNPAVSPDGHMIAFVRGSRTFLDPGQVYVKLLPDADPVALTHDDYSKMAPTFSPDGSRIAYTVVNPSSEKWETWTVPVLGGEPQPMLTNAAALSWIGGDRVLFSEIKRGVQMAVVTATHQRSEVRDVYVPPGMAHRSFVSPDARWVLIASEMNASGWLPCRLVPIDGHNSRVVGPPAAKCTYAAWSPDGRWMYFSAETDVGFHTWRQRFPDGPPEQITFGATEEEGIAMWPDGRSFASSVGTAVSAIWLHHDGTDRQITSDGYGHLPAFSIDGKTLYYLRRVTNVREWAAGELWAVDLSTDKHRRVLPGITMSFYEVSDDGSRVLFARTDPGQQGIWVGRVDGALPPVQLTSQTDTRALFGPAGTVVFEARENRSKYLFRMQADGSRPEKVAAEPIITLRSVSPNRRWAVVSPGSDLRRLVAYSLVDSESVTICENCGDGEGGPVRGRTPPPLSWSPDGQSVYLRLDLPQEPLYESGKTYVMRLPDAGDLPPRFSSETELASMPGVQVLPYGGLFPGPGPSLYAYTRGAIHRNIYRISLP